MFDSVNNFDIDGTLNIEEVVWGRSKEEVCQSIEESNIVMKAIETVLYCIFTGILFKFFGEKKRDKMTLFF